MKFLKAAILLIIAAIPAHSQSDMEYALSRHKSNKIVLLGEWSANDSAKWKNIIGSQEIYDHGFILMSRQSFSGAEGLLHYGIKNIDAFESWLRQRYGLSASVRWLALDNENNPIQSGIQIPELKEFDKLLEARGIKTPLRKLRDFLRENPGHLDAMADLLKEARRRALRQTPDGATGELDDETDLRTWGIMAAETDKVFSDSWLGADISFFRLWEPVPERRSKLMKAVFRKHISKVESAVRLAPTNISLWNIWVWMASGIGDYKWEKFIDGIEPIIFHVTSGLHSTISVPSAEACAWLVQEAGNRKEWSIVTRLANVARRPVFYQLSLKTEWLPGHRGMTSVSLILPEGHPVKTVYVPHIEALLRLGDIDEANKVYDRMIRTEGVDGIAAIADVARSLGMEDLAQIWGRGEQVNPKPSIVFKVRENYGRTSLLVSKGYDSDIYRTLFEYVFNLKKHLSIFTSNAIDNTIGWQKDENRWALISEDNSILYQDSSIPSLDEFQAILNRFDIIESSIDELYRKYIKDNGTSPGIELSLGFHNIIGIMYAGENADTSDSSRNEALAIEARGYLNRVMMDNPDILVYLPEVIYTPILPESPDQNSAIALITPLARPLLSKIESLIEKKPSAENLWGQWLFWNQVEGQERSLESMVERINLSPLSDNGILGLRGEVIKPYLEDCKKNGSWHKVAALLKTAWDREYPRLQDHTERLKDDPEIWTRLSKYELADVLGLPLIEAYLQDGKPVEADEIFKAVMDLGGSFKDLSKIIELAKAKGNENLATRWQTAINR